MSNPTPTRVDSTPDGQPRATRPPSVPGSAIPMPAATARPEATLESSRAPTRRPGRAGGKRDTNRRERTEALHRAALGLFLERGIENVTVDEIARAAGTAKGNFYRYANDKRELVVALLQPVVSAFDTAFDRCETQVAKVTGTPQLTMAYLGLAMELKEVLSAHPDIVRLWLQESRGPSLGARVPVSDFERRITDRTIALTEAAHRHGLLKKIPAAISGLAVIGAVERLLIAHLRDGIFSDPNEVVRQLVRLVMEGIA